MQRNSKMRFGSWMCAMTLGLLAGTALAEDAIPDVNPYSGDVPGRVRRLSRRSR
jgi:hypothetical protein